MILVKPRGGLWSPDAKENNRGSMTGRFRLRPLPLLFDDLG
jgi:hypothetical protein